MERAGRSLSKLIHSDKISTEELARAAWPVAVGKRLAAHAVAVGLVRDHLIVEVEDAIWQKQLFHLRHQILKRLRETIGDELIADVEFRIAGQRRPPQVATKVSSSTDDANGIEDPIMRRLYRQSREKASA
jgi:hypothetical protein